MIHKRSTHSDSDFFQLSSTCTADTDTDTAIHRQLTFIISYCTDYGRVALLQQRQIVLSTFNHEKNEPKPPCAPCTRNNWREIMWGVKYPNLYNTPVTKNLNQLISTLIPFSTSAHTRSNAPTCSTMWTALVIKLYTPTKHISNLEKNFLCWPNQTMLPTHMKRGHSVKALCLILP